MSHASLINPRKLMDVPFATTGLELIGEGFNTLVFRSVDAWTVKVAKFPDVLPRLMRERNALPTVQRISVGVPHGYRLIRPGPALPFGGACYQHIEGIPCRTLAAAQQQQLALAMLEIHRTPAPAQLPELPLRSWRWSDLARHLHASEVKTLREVIAGYPSHCATRCFVHGDLWPQNLVERQGRLVGLLDWEHSGIGDVAMDFAGLAYLSGEVMQGVLDAYVAGGGNVGSRFPDRLRACRLSRELAGLAHAIAHPGSGELDDALLKVRSLLRAG